MASESKVHNDSTVAAALASSSDHPNSQALELEDEVDSNTVIDALKVFTTCLFVYSRCTRHVYMCTHLHTNLYTDYDTRLCKFLNWKHLFFFCIRANNCLLAKLVRAAKDPARYTIRATAIVV